MVGFLSFVSIVIVLAIVIFFVALIIAFMRWMWRSASAPLSGPATNTRDRGMSAEEEGNVHSGPYGYSPNTAYPETQYGSLFNPDAEWNHEEQ